MSVKYSSISTTSSEKRKLLKHPIAFLEPKLIGDVGNKTINNDLHDAVRLMDGYSNKALARLKSIALTLSNSETNRRWLASWVDNRGLDLLQCAIINDKVNIIHFLLRDMELFPDTYQPKSNPYAHLAAMIGNQECLETVLTYRPLDYFAGSEPQHIVKLPNDVTKRLKMGNTSGMINKSLSRVVQMVREESANAERKLGKTASYSNESFEQDLINLESSFKETTHKPRKRLYHTSVTLPRLSIHQSQNVNNDKIQYKTLKILHKKKEIKSKVTVHMDISDVDNMNTDRVIREDDIKNLLPNTPVHKERSQPQSPPSTKALTYSVPKTGQKHRLNVMKRLSTSSKCSSVALLSNQIELGVRRIKKYKAFIPVFENKPTHIEDPNKYMDKTPLTLAAEKNHLDCVIYLLRKYHSKKGASIEQKNALTLATKARSPEAIALLLEANVPMSHYQNAVLLALRELYPDSLSTLLSLGGKNRSNLFEGTNLFHTLYSQKFQANYRYEMLPEMTRVLINCREEVNARNIPRTYPLYTLIQCAFNVNIGQQSLHYITCLKMLLNAKANPHYDETPSKKKQEMQRMNLARPFFYSAIHCILVNAYWSLQRFEVSYWSQIIMQKFMSAIEVHDKTPRRIHNDMLFLYMNYVTALGLNRRILRILLRYGANPDQSYDGKYPLNMFFEKMIPFLTKFEFKPKFHTYEDTVDTLLVLCKAMNPICLHKAVIHFLDNHLLSTPLQAMAMTRSFCYHVNNMIMSPRPLTLIASQFIWIRCRRNAKNVQKLPIPEEIMQFILP